MIVLDAGVLIAHLSQNDPFSDAALEILDTEQELAIHALNLGEVLVHPARSGQAQQLAEHLALIGIQVPSAHANESLELAQLRAATGLKMPDCCALMLAERLDATLATFDERLAQTARDLGVAVVGAATLEA